MRSDSELTELGERDGCRALFSWSQDGEGNEEERQTLATCEGGRVSLQPAVSRSHTHKLTHRKSHTRRRGAAHQLFYHASGIHLVWSTGRNGTRFWL